MESRGIDQSQIVDGIPVNLVETKDSSTADVAGLVEDVSVTLDSSLAGRGEELKVRGVLDENHVALGCSGTVDDTVELQSPAGTTAQADPSVQCIVAGGNEHDSSSLASVECLGDSRTNVSFAVRLPTIVENAADLLGPLRSSCGCGTNGTSQLSLDQRAEQGGRGEQRAEAAHGVFGIEN